LRKKRLSVIIGLLSVFVMVLASCNTATTSTSTTSVTKTTTTTTKTTTTTSVITSDKPQYGGTITLLSGTNFQVFSPGAGRPGGPPMLWEQITNADRTRGPAGSKIVDYGNGPTSMEDVIGCLASKWSTPDPNTWVLDIRQGVYWSNIPNNAGSALVGGREMTADDIIASLEANRDQPKSWAKNAEAQLHSNMKVEKTGQWQVTVHVPVNPSTAYLWLMGGGGSQFIWPKEWIPKYYEDNNWNIQVGTGPYYITDFVDNSILTMARNTKYWDTNPVGAGKGDQLPYIDNIKFLIVPDTSTQISALRTGKAEMVATGGIATGFDRDDALNLMQTNPNIKSYKFLAYPYQVGMRRDKTELPYNDINVRKALMMATDMKSIATDMYGGEAELLASPSSPLFPTCYTALDKLPAETQELYQYNPDKAKQLLKDAGYSDGFNATMVVSSSPSSGTDMAETLKAMWAKVGVNLTIQLKEVGAFSTIWATRNYDDLMLTQNCGGDNALFVRYSFGYFRGQNSYNISYVNDPIGSDPTIETAFQEECKYINADFAKCDKIHKDANAYILSQAFLIPTPAPYQYRMWQPWLKDFYGEGASKHWIQYVWLDQSMKSTMTK
jgi:peptide/nickel transport system substrate-binding protein